MGFEQLLGEIHDRYRACSQSPVSSLASFGRGIANFFAGIAEGQEIARRYEELSLLSDEALAARGITRDELPQAIVSGRIGR